MSRKSKVYFIASGIIVLVGVLLCLTGAAVGKAKGEQIFPEKTEAGRCYTYYFGSPEIGKVSLSAKKAQINIVGSSEKSFIEIINFNENLCTYSGSNAMITFRENPDVSSALRFWESGFTFKGLRYLLRSGGRPEGGVINVYLGDDVKVTSFDISVTEGKINISDVGSLSDYNLSVECGSVSLKNVTGASSVNVTATGTASSAFSLDNVSGENVCVKAQIADLKTGKVSAKNCEISVRTGSASVDFAPPEGMDFAIAVASKGKLEIDGCTGYIDSYSYVPEKEKGDEEKERADVKISGEDLSVKLTTPLPDTESAETEKE